MLSKDPEATNAFSSSHTGMYFLTACNHPFIANPSEDVDGCLGIRGEASQWQDCKGLERKFSAFRGYQRFSESRTTEEGAVCETCE